MFFNVVDIKNETILHQVKRASTGKGILFIGLTAQLKF
jgi:hypothetical protein